jgi:DNA polymerase
MTAAEKLLSELRAKSVQVELAEADKLRIEAPPGVVARDEIERLRALKPALLLLLRRSLDVFFLDFETRSLASLRKLGGRAYAEHETTEVLCAVFRLPDGQTIEWQPSQAPPLDILALATSGASAVCHNVAFDRFIWLRLGWPEPKRWIDTLELARMAGFPEKARSLGALGEAFLGKAKDDEGRALTLSLGKPDRKTKTLRPVQADELARVVRYCRADIDLLEGIFRHLAVFDRHEPDVRALDLRINDRGFFFDAELAQAVIDCDTECRHLTCERANAAEDVLSSHAKLKAELMARGVRVDNVQKNTLKAKLGNEIPDDARALIDARVASATIASKKLSTALRRMGADGRIRDSLVNYAAHTGRWGGRGFQPQNLPRGISDLDVDSVVAATMKRDVGALCALAKKLGVSVNDVIASLVRPCICAPDGLWLGVVDYAQIEARALAWLASDHDALDLFRAGRDPYVALSARIYGVPAGQVTSEQRKLGKQAELGCGYGMAAERFESQASAAGVDWFVAGTTSAQVVETWRDAHSAIAGINVHAEGGRNFRTGGLWQELQHAAIAAAKGRRVHVGPLEFGHNDDHVVCVLPSGRRMVYRHARIEKLPGQRSKRPGFTYLNSRGKREPSYGGKLAENVTQAICRDILAEALMRLDRAGFPVVLHVHDEVVAELDCETRIAEMKALMAEAPAWAADLPLAVEGYVAKRYRK